MPDRDLHYTLGFYKYGGLKLQRTICYHVEQTDWRIKFEKKKTELLTKKEEKQLERWRGGEGRRQGRERLKEKGRKRQNPSKNSYVRHIYTQITQIHTHKHRQGATHTQKQK